MGLKVDNERLRDELGRARREIRDLRRQLAQTDEHARFLKERNAALASYNNLLRERLRTAEQYQPG